jgi:hypothetical protein
VPAHPPRWSPAHRTLTGHNQPAETPLAISQALHSYFAVSDIRNVAVEGLHGCRYIETFDDWQTRKQVGALHQWRSTVTHFDTPTELSILDRVAATHSPAIQRLTIAVRGTLDRGQSPTSGTAADAFLAGYVVYRTSPTYRTTSVRWRCEQHLLSVSLWAESPAYSVHCCSAVTEPARSGKRCWLIFAAPHTRQTALVNV